jgi:hypothetical protein
MCNHSSLLHGKIGVLDVALILLLLEVFLEPGDEVARGGELLVVEVKARAADLDEFADGVAVLEHVDEEDELRVVLGDAKVVVDVAAVLLGLATGLALDGLDGQVQELLVGGDVLHEHVHGLDALLDDLLQAVVAAVVTVLDAVGHVQTVDAPVLALHLYVHDHPLEELPGYRQVLGPLRTRPDYEVADCDLGVFYHLDGWRCADVLVFGVGDPSEVCLQVLRDDLLLLHLNNRSVFLLQLEPILV